MPFIEPATDLLDASCRNMHERTVAGWLQISLVLSPFCHRFDQTIVIIEYFSLAVKRESLKNSGKIGNFGYIL